jgi:uncharacterized protein
MINWKKVWIFLISIFVLNYLLQYIASTFMDKSGALVSIAFVINILKVYIPFVVAAIIAKIYKEKISLALGISFKWNNYFIVGYVFAILIALGSMGITLLYPSVSFGSVMFETSKLWMVFVALIIIAPTLGALIALGEESGWRGFLVKELDIMSFWKKAIVIGIIWGIYILPISNSFNQSVMVSSNDLSSHVFYNIMLIFLFAFFASPLCLYMRLKGQGVIASSIFIATLASFRSFAGMSLNTSGEVISNMTLSTAMIVSLVVANIIMVAFDKYIAKEKVIFVESKESK